MHEKVLKFPSLKWLQGEYSFAEVYASDNFNHSTQAKKSCLEVVSLIEVKFMVQPQLDMTKWPLSTVSEYR